MNGKAASLVVLAALALGLGGCAHEAPDVSYPQSAGGGWVVPANYSWPPTATALGALAPTPSKSTTVAPASIFAKSNG